MTDHISRIYLISVRYAGVDAWENEAACLTRAQAREQCEYDLRVEDEDPHELEWVNFWATVMRLHHGAAVCPGFEACSDCDRWLLYVDGHAWYRIEGIDVISPREHIFYGGSENEVIWDDPPELSRIGELRR